MSWSYDQATNAVRALFHDEEDDLKMFEYVGAWMGLDEVERLDLDEASTAADAYDTQGRLEIDLADAFKWGWLAHMMWERMNDPAMFPEGKEID